MILKLSNHLTKGSRLEEEYFFKREQELIRKFREAEKTRLEQLEKSSHINRCSHCGTEMEHNSYDAISFLYCQSCQSVHLTSEDLEALTNKSRLKKFNSYLNSLKLPESQSA